MIYISGTAAIRGEESIVTGDVLVQTEITLENIQHLIGLEEGREKLPEHSGKLELLRVYLKHEEDAKIVKEDMDKLCPDVPIVYFMPCMQGRTACRNRRYCLFVKTEN